MNTIENTMINNNLNTINTIKIQAQTKKRRRKKKRR